MTLDNWILQLDLYCESSFIIGLFGSVFFIGMLFGSIFIKLSDKYGRKKILLIIAVINLICTALMIFIQHLETRIVLFFVIGTLAVRIPISYMLASEIFPDEQNSIVAALQMSIDMITGVLLPSIYYWFVSDSWLYLFYFYLGMSLLSLVFILFLDESPKLLYEQ